MDLAVFYVAATATHRLAAVPDLRDAIILQQQSGAGDVASFSAAINGVDAHISGLSMPYLPQRYLQGTALIRTALD